MKFLIEIGHPAHVHFFRRTIEMLRSDGHGIFVVSRAKEVTNKLLDSYGIEYQCLSTPAKNFRGLLFELLGRWWRIYRIIRREKIDVAVSISGISTAVPAKLAGIRNLTFTDTEDANITNYIAFPFSDKIYTPNFFRKALGKKQVRYEGLHELAYLQNFDFESAKRIREEHELPERYVFVRLVANDALHDLGLQLSVGSKLRPILQKLEKRYGAVLVSSQEDIPNELAQWQLKAPASLIHEVLAGASLFVGDSPTMSVESAILGVESHLVTPRFTELGNMIGMQDQYGLLRNHASWDAFLDYVEAGKLGQSDFRKLAQKFRETLPQMNQLIHSALLEA